MDPADGMLRPLAAGPDPTRWAAQAVGPYLRWERTNRTRRWPGLWLSEPPLAQPLTLADRRHAAITTEAWRLVGLHARAACMPAGGWSGRSIWLPKRSA
jgi:hypothetical protein